MAGWVSKRTSRSARQFAVVALLAVLAVAGWAAYAALAAPPPAAPSITARPTNPTASTAAALSYKDTTTSGFTRFECSKDGGSYTACGTTVSGSSTSYAVAGGTHTFAVRAVFGSTTTSATSYAWTVDTAAPTATISFPANGGSYNAPGYAAGCSPAGICGTAADASGVASVRLSIKQASSNKYWNGSGFAASAETFPAVTSGTTSWKYSKALPPDGSYTVHVQATDTLGNAETGTTYAASSTFTVDTAPPPVPSINSGPAGLVNSASASFGFADTEAGVNFLCKLDGGAYSACTSPAGYTDRSQGGHTFSVEAKDAAGNISTTAAARSWTVDTLPPPAPSITSGPANGSYVSSTSASFGFTDSEAGVTFLCKLDSGSFGACTSLASNTGLSQGGRTFSVEAEDAAGNVSLASSRSWTVDTLAPNAPAIPVGPFVWPPLGWASTSASFVFADSASDVGSFLCEMSPAGTYTACSNPATFNSLAQGQHALLVKAVDFASNVSGPSSPYVFFVDTVDPNVPTFTVKPPNPNSVATSTFNWTDSDPGYPTTGSGIAGYLCSVENGPYLPLVPSVGGLPQLCQPGVTYNVGTTNNGEHQFAVVAVDWAGNVSQAASYKWKVNKGSLQDFTINGDGTTPLYPGAPGLPVNLGFNNTNASSLAITSLVVAIASVNAPNATVQHPCSTSDYAVTQYSGSYPFTMPSGHSTLQSIGIASNKWPTVSMKETNVNQNGCAGASVTLSYTGSAQG